MPLLNKKPFKPQPLPAGLRPDEEVYVCSLTKEVFRNYDDFFNRYFLCKTFAWTCELTGKPNLTYEQAVESEREALAMIESIPSCHRRAILSLVHHAYRSNIKTASDEIFNFLKDRYVVGEELEYNPVPETKGSLIPVKVIQVIPPALPQSSPVKISVINTPLAKPLSPPLQPPQVSSTPIVEQATAPVTTNGPQSIQTTSVPNQTPSSQTKKATPRSQLPVSPISFEAKLPPSGYQYVVESLRHSGQQFTVSTKHLSRPKSILKRDKIRLFMRNSLYHLSEKSPLFVKDEYVKQYDLGPTTVKFSASATTPGSARKRNLSQTSLDSFLSPKDTPKKSRVLSILPATKPRKKPQKKTPKSAKNRRISSSSQSSSAIPKSMSVPATPKTPKLKPTNSAVTPSSSIGAFNAAKKVIKKAKMMKQLDLKGKFAKQVNKKFATEEEMAEARKQVEQQRLTKMAARLAEKEKIKEERTRKLMEQKEQRRMEKRKKLEWMKPREDLLCEDSKPLPTLSPLVTELSPQLFGDAVMVLEFFHHFGPVFNLRDAIRTSVTYDKLVEALISCSPDTILFGMFKFLLQAIFAAMEEEHENAVKLGNREKSAVATKEDEEDKEADGTKSVEGTNSSNAASRRSSVGSIPVEGMEQEKERSLDVRMAALKSSAAVFAKWSHLTQSTSLQKLVLDPYTCSEVLRLHLLSSGGYHESGDRNWCRHSQRGGFLDSDDPVLELRLSRPDLMEDLAVTPLYDLPPADKLTLLSTLCTQLLMYAVSRDHMDDISAQLKELRSKSRTLLNEERKRKEEKEKAIKNKLAADAAGGQATEDPKSTGDTEPKPATVTTRTTRSKTSEETEEERAERVQQELQSIEEEVYVVSATRNLRPLGYDRFFNRYWLFPALSGLFREEVSLHEPPVPQSSASLASPQAKTTTSTIMHITSPHHNHTDTTITSPQKQAASSHSPSPPSPAPTWSYFKSTEELDNLLACLNSRGNRELKLKQAIEKLKDKVCFSISNCRFLPSVAKVTIAEFGHTSSNQFLELYLREQILDIEEKIYVGGLGYIKDIDDRDSWRDYIENSGAAAAVVTKEDKKEDDKKEDETAQNEQEVFVPESADSSQSVQDLARALLQIQTGIEKRCLLPPLGTAVDKQKYRGEPKKNGLVKESDLCLDQWRASLAQATSFPQIFVHLSTLERAIAWRKSLMYVRCRICRRKGGDEYMLLCDGCDHGYHTYCLRPPLSYVPEGDWFCYDCCPVTPVKRKRRVPIVEVESSDSEPESEEKEAAESESNDDVDDEEDEESENQDNEIGGKKSLRQSTRVQRKATISSRRPNKKSQPAKSSGNKKKKANVSKSVSPCPGRATRVKKKLLLDDSVSTGSSSAAGDKAEVIISSIINLRCSKNATSREHESLEQQLCEALLDELMHHSDSKPFMAPVRRKDFPDYYKVITQPIDLKTIRQKVITRKYSNIDDFLRDVDLLFSNCSRYYKRRSSEAMSGASLRKFFEQRYSDLGLRNLTDVNISGLSNPIQLRSRRI